MSHYFSDYGGIMENFLDVKVILTNDMHAKLVDDMIAFGYKKNNQKASYTNFFRDVIIKTHQYQKYTNKIDKIKKVLLDKSITNNTLLDDIRSHKDDILFNQQITDLVILLSNATANEDRQSTKSSKVVHIKENKYTLHKLRNIINESNQLNNSEVCKSLLSDYLSYPLYTREKILFFDLYNTLMNNKNNNLTSILLTSNDKEINFELYDIKSGNSEFHCYALGFIHNESHKKICIKLCNIKNVYAGKSTYTLTDEDKNEAQRSLEFGAEWFGAINKETIIQFDDKGLELYDQLYKDRPQHDETKYNSGLKQMTFTCSDDQLFTYFIHFGQHAKVMNNDILFRRFKNFFTNAANRYN